MISKKDIESIPIKGDIKFREKRINPKNTALLIVDLQKGEYNSNLVKKNVNNKYLYERIKKKSNYKWN